MTSVIFSGPTYKFLSAEIPLSVFRPIISSWLWLTSLQQRKKKIRITRGKEKADIGHLFDSGR
jgi:hypothetical protein